MNYKLYVYCQGRSKLNGKVELNVFMMQHIKGKNLPEALYVEESALGVTFMPDTKYLVEVNADLDEVISVVEIINSGVWIMTEINDENVQNNKISTIGLKKKRDIVPIPPGLAIDETKWEFIIATVLLGKYNLFTGPTGCGKTVCAMNVAKALDYDFYPINCGSLFKPKQSLVGSIQAKEGTTFVVDSEFLTYFKSDRKTIIFLDEISRIPAQASNYMMTILDREQSYIYVEEMGQRIYKGKDVIFIAAANFGIQYSDTRKLDDAMMNRFIPSHMNYLTASEEERLINMKVPNLNPLDVKNLVKMANIVRQNYESIGMEVSHRHTIDLAAYFTLGFSFTEVKENLFINLFVNGSDDKRETVIQMLNGKIP